jgi:hypothetical protein
MAAALGMIGGGIVSGVGSFLGGRSQAKAQEKAMREQLAYLRERDKMQAEMAEEELDRATLGRPSGFQDDAINFLKVSQDRQPAGSINAPMLTRLNELDPAFRGAADALSTGVYGGGYFSREQLLQDEINRALEEGGLASHAAINEATLEDLGRLRGRAMRQGFTGVGSGELSALARARAAGRRNAALDLSSARVAQAEGNANVTSRDIARQLANLTAARSVMESEGAARLSPALAEQALFTSRSPAAFSMYKGLKSGAPQPLNQQPTFAPTVGAGQTAGAALQGFGNNLMQFSMSDAGQKYFDRFNTPSNTGGAVDWSKSDVQVITPYSRS